MVAAIVLAPSLSGAQQVSATMPKDHNGQAIWCSGFFGEIEHQAMNDNNQMIFDWANTQLTHLQHEAMVNPARAMPPWSEAPAVLAQYKIWHSEIQNGRKAAGAGLWELNGYSGGMSDREFILTMRRPDEDFCSQMADNAATWEGEYARRKAAKP